LWAAAKLFLIENPSIKSAVRQSKIYGRQRYLKSKTVKEQSREIKLGVKNGSIQRPSFNIVPADTLFSS
jgi:hypothetical protein